MQRSRRSLPEAEIAAMHTEYSLGDKTYAQIAEAHHLTYDQARRILQAGKSPGYGRTRATGSSYSRHEVSSTATDASRFLASKGLTLVQVAKATRLSRSAISHAFNGRPVFERNARILFAFLAEQGYQGSLDEAFKISHGLGAPRRGTPAHLIQRKRASV